MKVPIYLPKETAVKRCACGRGRINLEYKTMRIYWKTGIGGCVKKGDAVCEAEAEKAVVEVLSPADGTLASIEVGDGEEAGAGQVLGFIEK